MDSIQVGLFFLISYLLSRVFVTLKIPELVIYYLFEKKHISIQKLTLILLAGTTMISTIIANIITVLTLMPLVVLLQKELKTTEELKRKFNTLFLLAVLWGANIGGIGMITGTTTNGILLGLFEIYSVPIARDFTFLSWAAWGLPLAAILCGLGWLILMLVFKPGKMMHKADFSSEIRAGGISRHFQIVGFRLALCFILAASGLSYLMGILKSHQIEVLIVTFITSAVFVFLILGYKWKTEDGVRKPLIRLKGALQDVPKKGLLWVILAFIISYILWLAGFHKLINDWFTLWLEREHSILLLYLIFALATTFVSELISNTAVQFTMFLVLFPMTRYFPDLSWQGMLIITLCSSCAFMTPLATPSNGLGFGTSGKVSLRYMMLAGFIMNLVCSGLIVLWVHFVVPQTLNWFF